MSGPTLAEFEAWLEDQSGPGYLIASNLTRVYRDTLPASYCLVDGEGEWWIYSNTQAAWIFVPNGLIDDQTDVAQRLATQKPPTYGHGIDEGASGIMEHYGIRVRNLPSRLR